MVLLPNADSEASVDTEAQHKRFEDDLDRHVNDCIKRPSRIRRTMRGVGAFLKTRELLVAILMLYC